VNKKNKLFLSNYPLTYQLLFINLLISFVGFISFIIFNIYSIKNDNKILLEHERAFVEAKNITNYLQTNSILRVPLYNENCEEKNNNKECENINLSDPELEPSRTQQYVFQNFLKDNFNIKVYNDNWIKFADTDEMYANTDVSELDITNVSLSATNIFIRYRNFYLSLFNKYRNSFIYNKYIDSSKKLGSVINIVSETIKKRAIFSKKFYKEDYDIIQIVSSPIIYENQIFGVVIISYSITSENINLGLNSFNLFNFYLFFVLVMLILTFFFSRSLVRPIKLLSKISIVEREKLHHNKKFEYPLRGDEIGTLSREIQSMSSDLKLQIDQLEKFAADVSHELKNPLTSLNSANDLLTNNKISQSDKKNLIRNMAKDIERMNLLISDIANFTKIKAEIENEDFEYINIIELVKYVSTRYKGNNKNIIINHDFNTNNSNNNKLFVLANKNKLAQVFLNIIDNSISISDKNKSILITIETIENKNVSIKIYDQGKGIPKDQAKRIFDRFYSDRDENRNNHSGLGLSIAKEIISTFKGAIKVVDSDKNLYSGACFLINLPLKIEKINL
tara:strand:+ start:2363 stop:4051 length:1689 start_codon:yes stop_codon:yes gene_type:complete